MSKRNVGAFDTECKVIDLVKEYGGESSYTGEEKFAIATNLPEKVLMKHFSTELEQYSPFVIITTEMYDAISECNANDNRERIRCIKFHEVMTQDLEASLIDEFSSPVRICESKYIYSLIRDRISELPELERSRLNQFVRGYTAKEIAEREGSDIFTVWKCLQRARFAVHNLLVECGVADYD